MDAEESRDTSFESVMKRGMGTRCVALEVEDAELDGSPEVGAGRDATKKGGNDDNIVCIR